MSTVHTGRAAPPPPGHVRVDVPIAAGREDAAEPIRQVLEAIAPFVAEGTVERQDAVFRGVVDKIIEATPMRRLDTTRAALEQRAIAALFSGTEWLTAEQVGRLRDPEARNPHGTANRWRAEGKVFALTKGGVLYYPRYAFDESLDPRPVVAEVMAVLAGQSPYRLASWFESTNSALGGKRPRALLDAQPARVLEAARRHAAGVLHG